MWIVTKALHTLYRIAVAQARRTIPDRIGLLFRHENSDSGAICVTKRSCSTAPISKVERHISDRFCVTLWCIVNRYSGHSGSEYRDLKIRGQDKLPRLPEANLHNEACAHEVQTRVLAVLVSSRTPFSRHLEDVSISRVVLTYNKTQSIPFSDMLTLVFLKIIFFTIFVGNIFKWGKKSIIHLHCLLLVFCVRDHECSRVPSEEK